MTRQKLTQQQIGQVYRAGTTYIGWIAEAIEQVFNTNKPDLKPITFFDKLIPNQLQQVIMWVHQK